MGLCVHLPSVHAGILSGWVLHRMFSCSHSYYEFICTSASLCLGNTPSLRFPTAAGLVFAPCLQQLRRVWWRDCVWRPGRLCIFSVTCVASCATEFYGNMTLSKDWNLQFWSRAKLSLVQLSNCPTSHSEKWHNFDHNEQKFGRKHSLFLDFTISV